MSTNMTPAQMEQQKLLLMQAIASQLQRIADKPVGGERGTKLQKHLFEPLILPGQVLRIEPLHKYGFFRVPRSSVIEVLPVKTINIATPFSQSIPVASDTGQQVEIPKKITDLDMQGLSLGHYRLFAKDPMISFTFKQPAAVGKFTNKAGPVIFDYSNTMFHVINQNWGQLPEVFIFEDQTPLTIVAKNMDMETVEYQARIGAFGFRYPLEPIRATDDQPAVTLSVEAKQ